MLKLDWNCPTHPYSQASRAKPSHATHETIVFSCTLFSRTQQPNKFGQCARSQGAGVIFVCTHAGRNQKPKKQSGLNQAWSPFGWEQLGRRPMASQRGGGCSMQPSGQGRINFSNLYIHSFFLYLRLNSKNPYHALNFLDLLLAKLLCLHLFQVVQS